MTKSIQRNPIGALAYDNRPSAQLNSRQYANANATEQLKQAIRDGRSS